MKRGLFLLMLFAITMAKSISQTFDYGIFKGKDGSLPYRIMKPSDASASKKYPLVIFLHGAGERGSDNVSQLNNGAEAFLKKFTGDYASIVVAPQCPHENETNSFWSNAISKSGANYIIDSSFLKEDPTPPMKNLQALVDSLINTESVDKNRVYVGGMSMGGFGTYELLWRMPSGTFAAAFPICGGSDTKNEKLENYAAYTPVWLFHGDKDDVVSVDLSRNVYTKLQKIKGSVIKYTEYAGVNHVSWNYAFADTSLIPWLFGYRNVEEAFYKIGTLTGNNVLTKQNSALSMADYDGSNFQQSWLLTRATAYSFKIQAGDGSNYYLSANGSSLSLSTTAITKNQYWKLVSVGKGVFNIISEGTGYALELTSNGFSLKTKDVNDANQKIKVAHSRMFLVGGATPGGWTLGSAQEMNAQSDGDAVFNWSGYLWASDFKFQSTKQVSWETSYTSVSTNKFPTFGEEQKLVVHPQNQYDFKFKLDKAGFYKLTMNMGDRNVIVTESMPKNIYLIGAAAPNGWNNVTPDAMTLIDEQAGLYKWEGLMNTGEFKFLTSTGSWSPSINPTSTQNISSGKTYPLNITNGAQGDYKFNISKSMYYTVIVDLKNMSMTITEKTIGIPLYILGTSVPNMGFDNTKALPVTQLTDSTYIWTGQLNVGQFKFITKLGTWNSIIPSKAENEKIISGYKHTISDNYQGDYRFLIEDAGNYTIKVNLAANTMIITKNPENIPLYILGTALPNIGFYNTKALTMTATSDSTYRWEGNMQAGQFKFITKLGTWYSIVPDRPQDEYIVCGYKHAISNYYQGDYRYIISENGYYTIDVDIINHTMMVTKSQYNRSPLYILGTALPNIGFYNTKAIGLNKISDSVYKWEGQMVKGEFKFITEMGTWSSIVPGVAANECIVNGYKHTISNYYLGDYRYIIPEDGEYTVEVDIVNHTMTVKRKPESTSIYILGTAIPNVGFYNTNALKMKSISDHEFTWTGQMNQGQFKFISQINTWNSIIPVGAANETIEIGKEHEISTYYKGDYRYVLSQSGNYTVTVNTEQRTVLVESALSLLSTASIENETVGNSDISIIGLVGTVAVGNDNAVWIERSRLMDMNGRIMASAENIQHSFNLGNNIPAGIYIVEILYAQGKSFTQKIIVK